MKAMPKLLKNTKNLKENLGLKIIIILISLINNKVYKKFISRFFRQIIKAHLEFRISFITYHFKKNRIYRACPLLRPF